MNDNAEPLDAEAWTAVQAAAMAGMDRVMVCPKQLMATLVDLKLRWEAETVEVRAKAAAFDRLEGGLRYILENPYWRNLPGPCSPKNNQCRHGLYGYEGCENCYDEYLSCLLAGATIEEAVRGVHPDAAIIARAKEGK